MSKAEKSQQRGPGRPFPPGHSGNPGGRPKGLAERIREATRDGADLVDFALAVLRGHPIEIPSKAKMADGSLQEIEVTDHLERRVRFQVPTLDDRRWAYQTLLERGHGREPEKIELSGPNGKDLIDPATLSAEALDYAANLARVVSANVHASEEAELPTRSGTDAQEPSGIH